MAQTPWSFAGGNISNTHASVSDVGVNPAVQINPANAGNLLPKWTFATVGDVSATPTVEQGGLYVPDWGGYLYKLDPTTGALLWNHAVCDYTASCGTANASISRSSPAIARNVIVIGDAVPHPDRAQYGAIAIGVDKATGAKVWSTVINGSSPYATIVGSPVVYNGIAYVGTASSEEAVAGAFASYKPTFRGNVTALDVNTGAVIWKFRTVPDGYSGGAIVGSSLVVWPNTNSLIIATGNNYSIPANIAACVAAAGATIAAQRACLDPTDVVDGVLSLDLTTGAIHWGRRPGGADTWNQGCESGAATCPSPAGADADFAQAPILTYVPNFVGVADDRGGTAQNYLLGIGRKNSLFYGINPLNGGLFWYTYVGTGGMQWGSALNADDLDSFFVAVNNPAHVAQTIGGVSNLNPHTWNAGFWEKLDVRTGQSKWAVQPIGADLVNPRVGATAPGCMTFTNRIVFAGSSSGVMVAMDAVTGYKYWYYPTAGTIISCPAIFNERVYWGTGYARGGVGKHMLYAFSVSGL